MKQKKRFSVLILLFLFVLPAVVFAGGKQEKATGEKAKTAPSTDTAKADTAGLPTDALPKSEQVLYFQSRLDGGTYMDFMKTIYNRKGLCEAVWEALIGFDKDLNVIPLEAKTWEVSENGLTWTFHLREGLTWSDGQPLTAHDYVFALERAVQEGYDFAWYWSWAAGIKNWTQIADGKLPVSELGIKALDDLTLQITSETPKPFLPSVLVWLYPVPRHAVQKWGNEYATKADTMVSNGPFKVTEWVEQSHMTLSANPDYKGLWKPILDKIITVYGTEDPEVGFLAYTNNEIYKSDLNPGQIAFAKNKISQELHSAPTFNLYYLSFNANEPPFDNVKVRQAFNHAINRDEMCSTILKDVASPEYALLMKGFPGNDTSETPKKMSKFDPESAKKLLAEAGYPNGEGFPEIELWIRNNGPDMPMQKPASEYIQAQLKKILGVDIIPRIVDLKTWIDAINNHTKKLYMAPYNFDYTDPSNFMDLFVSGGRHAWSNSEYDNLVKKADALGDWDERIKLYRQAEKLLIQEAPAVFLSTMLNTMVWKPFLKGEGVEPNNSGIATIEPMYMEYVFTHMYVTKH